MNAKTFAQGCRQTRDSMFASYSDPNSRNEVAAVIQRASLTSEQRQLILAALDTALTDSFYTFLLALDGAASLGDTQQIYTLRDELGNVVSAGDGTLEAEAWEAFHSNSG